MKLDEKRIVEIGFIKKSYGNHKYFHNNSLCLFPSDAGVWIIGWDFGSPVTGNFVEEFIPYITTEQELRAFISKINQNIPLKDS